jgi:molybdenum cofactor cytidylyltransferase
MTGGARTVHTVVLAAGASHRMGRPKALLAVGTLQALEVLLTTDRAAGHGPALVVVAAPHGSEVAAVARAAGARVVWNPDPGRGMFSSVQLAIRQAPPGAMMIWPVDHALVRPSTVTALTRALPRSAQAAAVVPVHGGRAGHPVLVTPELREQIEAAAPGETLRQVLHRATRVEVRVDDPLVLLDANTPADWEEAVRLHQQRQG